MNIESAHSGNAEPTAVGGKYGALLLILLATLIAQPFLGAGRLAHAFLDMAVIVIFAAAIPAIWSKGKIRLLALGLGGAAIITSFAGRSLGIEGAYPYGAFFRTVLFAFLIAVIFNDILRREVITMDGVFGACCVYVLLGTTWGAAYAMLEWLYPGSFHFTPESISTKSGFDPTTMEFKLEYFSLITMTSVGYGDIIPVSPPARALAAIEALFSQLYLAIIVGRLVGLAIRQGLRRPS